MKTIKTIILATAVTAGALTFSSCKCARRVANEVADAVNAETPAMTIPSTDLPQNSGLVMTVTPDSFDGVPQTISVTITNNTQTVAQFGAEFVVEHHDGNGWSVVKGTENFPVIMIMYALPAGESQTYEFHMRPDVVSYQTGRYRISKRVMLDNTDNYGVVAEFTIR